MIKRSVAAPKVLFSPLFNGFSAFFKGPNVRKATQVRQSGSGMVRKARCTPAHHSENHFRYM